jgi:hypothetical protein
MVTGGHEGYTVRYIVNIVYLLVCVTVYPYTLLHPLISLLNRCAKAISNETTAPRHHGTKTPRQLFTVSYFFFTVLLPWRAVVKNELTTEIVIFRGQFKKRQNSTAIKR